MRCSGIGSKFNKLSLFSSLIAGLIFGSSAFAQSKRTVRFVPLYVGIFYDQPVPNIPADYELIGNYKANASVSYQSNKKTLRINPKKPGLATLFVRKKSNNSIVYEFRLDVRTTNLTKVAKEIRGLLANVEGISIKILNNKVIVDGQILLPRDMKRIHSVVKQYKDQAYSLVTLSPVAQRKIAQFIERDINNPEISVRALNGKFILEGVVDSQREYDKADIIAKAYIPDIVRDEAVADKKVVERQFNEIVINLITIRESKPQGPKKIIQLVVHYVELKKDYQKGFRFQWTPDLGDGSSIEFSTGERGPAGVVSTITGTISNLLPKLNWAKEHGHARVLQSASVIVEDSEKGVLNSVQRVPFIGVTDDGKTATQFEETGIRTQITPQVLGARSDSVKMKMNFSVKSLVGMTPSGPLTSSREIESVVVVQSGNSAAIGGLITSERGTDFNKLPSNVSDNPLISLYSSKTFRDNKSQFVVFVTPVIKSSASAGSNKIKRKFRIQD